MADKKTACSKSVSVLTASGLSAKSVTDVIITWHGSVCAIEIVYSGGSQFVKVKNEVADVGGTLEWGSGTQVSA